MPSTEKAGAKKRVFSFMPLILSLVKVLAAFIFIVIVFQDYLIFPGIAAKSQDDRDGVAPAEVQKISVNTRDGETISTWKLPVEKDIHKIALIAHGNGGSVRMFYGYQLALRDLGYTTYAFDYRGFGASTGSPSEAGFYQDIQAVWEKVQSTEKITAADLTVVGISVGSGPAAYLADRIGAGTLLLIAPYTSIPDVINDRPVLGYLKRFSRYYFPTLAYVASTQSKCIILVRGDNDNIINPVNTDKIEAAWLASKDTHPVDGTMSVIRFPGGDHNTVFFAAYPQISAKLAECGAQKSQ